jgi:IclR family acetate operon transcriptional repressor
VWPITFLHAESGAPGVGYLESVDNSLRLLLLVAAKARVGVSEAAIELGVAPSTAHRLLATLRYRGFVVQGRDRTYQAGPAMEEIVSRRITRANLAAIASPHLEALRDQIDESVHFSVLVGRHVRIIASAESTQLLRVGTREGAMLPAHLASGGRCLLAELDTAALDEIYPPPGLAAASLTEAGMRTLRRDLARVRKQGYAVNRNLTERGVTAVGVLARDVDGPIGALSVSIPSVRFVAANVPDLAVALKRTAEAIAANVRA